MIQYFRSKLNEIKRNYSLALEKNDIDGVHDLRVDIKRMKAFFNLVESISGDFNARKNFKNFRKIAKNTGGLRDTQVQQILLKKIQGTLNLEIYEYEIFLKNEEIENLESFRNFSEQEIIKKLDEEKKIFSRTLKNISRIHGETKAQGRFYNLRNDLVLLSSESDLRDEILHKVRILSKETHYTLEIVQQCFHLFDDGNKFIKGIKKVHQALGKWHDFDVSLIYMGNFLNNYSVDASAKIHNQLKQHILEEKGKLNRNFRAVFDEFKQIAVLL